MKYLWVNENGVKDTMQTSGELTGREYHIKMMGSEQHDCPKKAKRFRSAFTTDQVKYLEKQFKKFPYIGNAHRKEVAIALNIPERAVKIWFQNRRMKEKKESTSKESDDEHGIRKSLEFAKDQLNNISLPSTNEQPRSLPLLTDISQVTDKSMIINNNSYNMTGAIIRDAGIKDMGTKLVDLSRPMTVPNVAHTAKVIHPPSVFVKTSHSPSNYQTSDKFSINLCKKYKSESHGKELLQPALKKEVEEFKNNVEPKSVSPMEQTLPEDLSPNRKINFPTMIPQQTLQGNASNNSGYVSLVPTVSPFYTQPYLSASGMIWKPISVMPVVPSSSSPITAPSNSMLNMSSVQENVPQNCCCDCHVKPVLPQVPYNFAQQSQNPQYIITAVPFQNPSTKY